jgi:hypothetical protein
MRAFCDLINRTISDNLNQFYLNQYISASVIPEHIFKAEAGLLIEEFRSSVTNAFSLSLAMIRDTTQANALLSGLQTNYYVYVDNTDMNTWVTNIVYDDCACSSSSRCVEQISMYDYPNTTSLFDVPDFYIGCYMVESLFQSTLKCFYNQSCINKLESYILSYVSMDITALDASVPSLYSVNSTIQELVDNLMIEEWNISTMYESYYTECQPTQCSYKVETRNNVVYIVWNNRWLDHTFNPYSTTMNNQRKHNVVSSMFHVIEQKNKLIKNFITVISYR